MTLYISLNFLKKYTPAPAIPNSPATISNVSDPVLGNTGGAVAPSTGGAVGVGVGVTPHPQVESFGQDVTLQNPDV